MRLPGDSEPAAELRPGELQRPGLPRVSARVCAQNAYSSGRAGSKVRRAWSISPITTDGPSDLRPAVSGTRPRIASISVRSLPEPSAPRTDIRSAQAEPQVHRAQPERAGLDHHAVAGHDIAAALR